MNSLVQVLGKVKELREGINSYHNTTVGGAGDGQLVVAAKSMYKDLENKGESFPPYSFVQTLRLVHPQFDETDNQGRHMQQDSDECYNAILGSFERANLKFTFNDEEKNMISHLFDIEFKVTFENTQSEDEEKQVSYETSRKLQCHIDGGGKPINHLMDGLQMTLEGEVEKFSEHTQTQAVYKKTMRMNNLPPYL